MYEYKSEVLDTLIRYGFKDDTNDSEVSKIDDLINRRTEEGWEFVTHSFMSNLAGPRSSILITFRKPK